MIGWRGKPPAAEDDKPKGFDDYDLRLGDLMRGERATLGKSLLDVQRDLKIKATYIAAIENADVSAFETPGFVAGYVRSYARYLGMDPDRAFAQFCAEANYTPAHGMAPGASSPTIVAARSRASGDMRDPFTDPNATFIPRGESVLSRIEPGAVGSVAVLLALIGALGYGGWSLLQEVQRVQLAPVDQAPIVAAEIDPLGNVAPVEPVIRSAPEVPEAVADATPGDDPLDRLYRPEALDVPVMTPRDGPIAAINPRASGLAPAATVADAATPAVADPVQVLAAAAPPVELLAVRPSWVRVSAADGTVLFEKILDAGETYVVPQFEEAALLRTGNAGSVYFKVNGQAFGPAGEGASVVSKVALTPTALTQSYAAADLTADPDLARVVNVADASPVIGDGAAVLTPVAPDAP
jgi:cytoskeletal protein RodZ